MKHNVLCPVGILALALGFLHLSCATVPPDNDPSQLERETESLEVACELAMFKLQRLIEQRSQEPEFAEATLLEALTLYDMAKELYLERSYGLALDFLQEGIRLIDATTTNG